jgi:YfiH family protein
MSLRPSLEARTVDGVRLLVDDGALARGTLVAFTDREGGVSSAPFDSLNLALSGGDDHAAVRENRERVARAAGFPHESLVLARQVHGPDLVEVGENDHGLVGEADGLVTAAAGPVLGMLTADCAPVVVAGPDKVAVMHAGWRGLVTGIIERGVAAVGEVWGAWVGPCIHGCCYEVGPEVIDAFWSRRLPVEGRARVDCGRAAAAALHGAGVERVATSTECTSCDPRYFSYRRDGRTGRQGAFVARLAPEQ